MHHKRGRPKSQRAGCNCGSKLAKELAPGLRGSRGGFGGRALFLRLRERARDVALLVALALPLALTGCATGALTTFPRRPVGPDQQVVESLVCSGREAEARVYCEDRGASRPEITERVEKARIKCPPTPSPTAAPFSATVPDIQFIPEAPLVERPLPTPTPEVR